ncbi:MAG: c-type cytochrome [Lewinellaceae bacterium]|nr:c-type cytochrome [Phaeodactylibacter sp.]MCB9035567.1 c-type cytochrome [Lewinellaceae bacterium]
MKNKTLKLIPAALPLLLLSVNSWGQAAEGGAGNPYFYDGLLSYGMLFLAAAVFIAALAALYNLLNIMVKVQQIRIYQEQGIEAYVEETKKPQQSFFQRLYKRMTNVVPVEKEEDILFDHEYDGIRELDNVLPPWWVAMFYVTIAFGVVYYTYYHFAGAGPSSTEEYKMEMERAEKAVQAYLATQSNRVDETNAELLTDEQSIAAGKAIYEGKGTCFTCHGMQGEGGIGPNMTDPYWIHGGGIKDLFKTIKYGVPEKGMISWKDQLAPAEMQQVASYILSLQGTNPPNPKEPQGELYQQVDNAAPADTSATGANKQDADAIGMQ